MRTVSVPGLAYKVPACRTCGEPIFHGRNLQYCPEHRGDVKKRPWDYQAELIRIQLGRPLTRVEQYLIRTEQTDLIFVGTDVDPWAAWIARGD